MRTSADLSCHCTGSHRDGSGGLPRQQLLSHRTAMKAPPKAAVALASACPQLAQLHGLSARVAQVDDNKTNVVPASELPATDAAVSTQEERLARGAT